MDDEDRRSPTEKVVAGSLIDERGVGRPLSERAMQRQRSVESYLLGEALPRYMQRAREIERGLAEQERRLAAVHARLRAELPPEEFARTWDERAQSWDLSALNALIATHNEWYPIERDLPMDPRTGDYVPVNGRSHRREHVGPEWILQRFPVG